MGRSADTRPSRRRSVSGSPPRRSSHHRRRSRDREDSRHRRSASPDSRRRHRKPSPRDNSRTRHRRSPVREKDSNSKSHRRDNKTFRKSSKKSSRRSSSASSSNSNSSASSEGSADSATLLTRLEEERARKKEELRRLKEAAKAAETPEQKRMRRHQKRMEKERRRKERMGWDQEYLHYTNDDNPFGDSNLLETFRWDKKLQKEGLADASSEDLEKMNRKKMEDNKRELEKVKARRLERERERAEREQETALMQSKQEAEQFREWEKQEDQFHLRQCSLRSKIRIQEGRAKPIDLLAKYISSVEELDAVEVHEPYTYLVGLSISDLEDLQEDIRVYGELEHGQNRDFWMDVTVIVEDELQKLKKLDAAAQQKAAVGRRDGIHDSVVSDVTEVFRGKSATQLAALQTQIETKLRDTQGGVDVGYWESLLIQLKAHLARARLRDRHQENLREKLRLLKATQGVGESSAAGSSHADTANAEETDNTDPKDAEDAEDEDDTELAATFAKPAPVDDGSADAVDDLVTACLREYATGRYSPPLMSQEELEPGTLVADASEDSQRLYYARSVVQNQGRRVESAASAEEKALQQEAKKGMGSDEAQFSVETDLGHQTHLWSDKYRPRKPRYFNRVHTGFEWNKYKPNSLRYG